MEKKHVQYAGAPVCGTVHRKNMVRRLAAYRERMQKAGRKGGKR